MLEGVLGELSGGAGGFVSAVWTTAVAMSWVPNPRHTPPFAAVNECNLQPLASASHELCNAKGVPTDNGVVGVMNNPPRSPTTEGIVCGHLVKMCANLL